MSLYEMKKNEKGIIKSISATGELKKRLSSFGVERGRKFEVHEHSIAKSTIKLKIDTSYIALRGDEAECIEVEKI